MQTCLRSASTDQVLGHEVMAPSTLGTFLRSFTFGNLRQLDRLHKETLRRAWGAGAGPGDQDMTIDMDSTICEVYGKQKQGAAYGYTKVLGYHPLLATRADTGEALHLRMRKGSAGSARGAAYFAQETFRRVRSCRLRRRSPASCWMPLEPSNYSTHRSLSSGSLTTGR